MDNLQIPNACREAEEDIGDIRTGVIYMATCIMTGLSYIGMTVDFAERQSRHLKDAENGSDTHFYRAVRKYGADAFVWRFLAVGIPLSQLNTYEVFWIRFHNTFLGPGYNMTPGGDASPMDNPESVEKLRQTQLRQVDEGTHHLVTDNPMKKPETVEKVRKSNRKTSRRMVEEGTHISVTDNPMKKPEIVKKKVQSGYRNKRLNAIEAGQAFFIDDCADRDISPAEA